MLKMGRKKLTDGNSLFDCLEHGVVQEGCSWVGCFLPETFPYFAVSF